MLTESGRGFVESSDGPSWSSSFSLHMFTQTDSLSRWKMTLTSNLKLYIYIYIRFFFCPPQSKISVVGQKKYFVFNHWESVGITFISCIWQCRQHIYLCPIAVLMAALKLSPHALQCCRRAEPAPAWGRSPVLTGTPMFHEAIATSQT